MSSHPAPLRSAIELHAEVRRAVRVLRCGHGLREHRVPVREVEPSGEARREPARHRGDVHHFRASDRLDRLPHLGRDGAPRDPSHRARIAHALIRCDGIAARWSSGHGRTAPSQEKVLAALLQGLLLGLSSVPASRTSKDPSGGVLAQWVPYLRCSSSSRASWKSKRPTVKSNDGPGSRRAFLDDPSRRLSTRA